MKKYIYHRGIRCRIKIKYSGLKLYELQLQRKIILWVNIPGEWMTCKEGYWGDGVFPGRVIHDSYKYGNKDEAWPEGTLDLEERAKLFINMYLDAKAEVKAFMEHFGNT